MAKSRKQVQAVPAEDTESPVKSTVEMVPDAPTTVPAQDNVVTLSGLVSQSLKSGDAGLLETALGVTDQTVIEATLERIPAEQSTVLLKALLQRIEAKPSRLVHLMPWIRSTLVVHASFISTVKVKRFIIYYNFDVLEWRG